MRDDYFDLLQDMYRRERTQLLAFARGLCGDLETAEDAVQNAFERLLRRSSTPRDLRPFVYRSVRNASIDACRRCSNHRREDPLREIPAGGGDSDETLDLLAGLRALPRRERVAVVLCVVVGFTAAEAGRLLGLSPNTVATRRRRGLDRLRRSLEEA